MAGGKEMRAIYAETLIKLAEKDERIVVLEADLMKSTGTNIFRERFPHRAFNVGVAEANMIGLAAGLSASGKIPFPATFGCFAARRTFDQFFISANYARLNVKLTGTDPGITAALNGGTHMPFEDTGLMRCIPGLTVFEPSDGVSLAGLLEQGAYHPGCTYMRLHRKEVPVIYPAGETFELGKAKVLMEGSDLSIIACGSVCLQESLRAADTLRKEGITVRLLDMHTVKPADREAVIACAADTGAILTVENHQVIGGLGSAVAEILVENRPVPMKRVGIRDEFGEVGTQEYLAERFGLTAENILRQARELLKKK
ncbi:MAG: transketolase family protein [Spirochaetales bacterium]|nr:transketolase family protein [Spirochaetales bacterium]